MNYLLEHRRGKRKYAAKITIRPTRRVGFEARMKDDAIAFLDKLLRKKYDPDGSCSEAARKSRAVRNRR